MVTETITVLGAVLLSGPAESQLEFWALATVQFKVPPPVLVICRFCDTGKEPLWMALKCMAVSGESEMKSDCENAFDVPNKNKSAKPNAGFRIPIILSV